MGISVREKIPGSGEYWIFIRSGSKRSSRKIGTKVQAMQAATILRGKMAAGADILPQEKQVAPPFKSYCERWVKSPSFWKGAKKPRKESTLDDYGNIITYHLRGTALWEAPIDQISRNDIEEFVENCRSAKNRDKPLSASSKNHILVVLSHVFKYASNDGADVVNHARGITISTAIDPNKPLDDDDDHGSVVYSPEEIERLLAKLEGKHCYPAIFLLARTGLRCAEAAGLKWEDVDLDARVITVRRGWVRGRETSPKSGKIRYVDMSHDLVDMLRQHRRRQFQDRHQNKNNLVFQNTLGGYIDLNSIRKGRTAEPPTLSAYPPHGCMI